MAAQRDRYKLKLIGKISAEMSAAVLLTGAAAWYLISEKQKMPAETAEETRKLLDRYRLGLDLRFVSFALFVLFVLCVFSVLFALFVSFVVVVVGIRE